MQWIKIEDIRKTEDFDTETGISHVSYYMKISTPDVEIESDLNMVERMELKRELDDEAIYAMEQFFEDFVFSRMENSTDYDIVVEDFVVDGDIPSEYKIFVSTRKKSGSVLMIMNPQDLNYLAGKDGAKILIEGLTKKKVGKVKFEFKD